MARLWFGMARPSHCLKNKTPQTQVLNHGTLVLLLRKNVEGHQDGGNSTVVWRRMAPSSKTPYCPGGLVRAVGLRRRHLCPPSCAPRPSCRRQSIFHPDQQVCPKKPVRVASVERNPFFAFSVSHIGIEMSNIASSAARTSPSARRRSSAL